MSLAYLHVLYTSVTKVICEHDLDGYWKVPAGLQKIYQLVNNIINCNVIN